MKVMILILFCVYVKSIHGQIEKDTSIRYEDVYFNRSKNKIKKRSYFDINNNYHPKIISYYKDGSFSKIYYYDKGNFLLSHYYKRGETDENNPYKIHGVKIDKSYSKAHYSIDSSSFKSSNINYLDSNGLKQGKWYEKVIIKDIFGYLYRDFYCIGEYINGKKQGKWQYYNYYEKRLKYIVEYQEDVIEGDVIIFYKSGSVSSKYEYLNGKKQGKYEAFYENGQLHVYANFNQGEFVGEYIEYEKNGEVKKKIEDSSKVHPYK